MANRIFTDEGLLIFVNNIKNYIDTKITSLINSAPETMDTLGELADALSENENVIEVLDAAITTKANISDLQATQEEISSLKSQILSDSFILADAITGNLHVIQIQNGKLVSMSIEEFEVM